MSTSSIAVFVLLSAFISEASANAIAKQEFREPCDGEFHYELKQTSALINGPRNLMRTFETSLNDCANYCFTCGRSTYAIYDKTAETCSVYNDRPAGHLCERSPFYKFEESNKKLLETSETEILIACVYCIAQDGTFLWTGKK